MFNAFIVEAVVRSSGQKVMGACRGGKCGVPGPLMRAIRSLSNAVSCICILGIKLSVFLVGVGLYQGCPLSSMFFLVFIHRISRRNQGQGCVCLCSLRITALLFGWDEDQQLEVLGYGFLPLLHE